MTNGELQMPPGPAADAAGRTATDPSVNVLALVASDTRRQDDLREAESAHVREIVNLRASYDNELRASETARINAIRAVDVGAVAAAAQVQATQATTLAAQVASSAEAMRTQVETTRLQLQAQYSAALEPIIKDVTDLRRVQYETAGGKAQTHEGRDERDSKMAVIVAAIMVAAIMSAAIIGVAGIAVTLILHG
jgi:hypothetical protein